MKISQEKQKKLAYVARRYYLEDQRQSDIAKELGVSRPMVSRMLAEARELGVVEITVHDAGTRTATLLERLRLLIPRCGGAEADCAYGADVTVTALFPEEAEAAFRAELTELSGGGVEARPAGTVLRAFPVPGRGGKI